MGVFFNIICKTCVAISDLSSLPKNHKCDHKHIAILGYFVAAGSCDFTALPGTLRDKWEFRMYWMNFNKL